MSGHEKGGVCEYVYDAFGRLRKINRTDNQNLVIEYFYNPLGFRRSWKYDTDVDGDTDANDLTFQFASYERWRIHTSAKEEFVYHNAGSDGYGSSSYIDAIILRDQDANSGWTSAADGTLEKRDCYCQNWRADVVCMITSSGTMGGWMRCSAYGVPYGIPRATTMGMAP